MNYKTKFLIVEDEVIVALELKMEIEKLGCEVIALVKTKNKVLESIKDKEPDIILMDITLGKNQNGIDIVKQIQKIKDIPILYITALSDDVTIKKAFETNPIGYIVKPYRREDLRTNIKLAIYKINKIQSLNINKEYIDIGENFYFDREKEELYFQNDFIKLGAKEKHLLSILTDANHATVPFSNLEDEIWDGNKPSKSALRTLVYRLKGKLGNNIIQVVYGYGYSLKPII